MEKLSESMKTVLLAGVGVMAATAEKSKEILDDMVRRGEITVEQSKVLNEELKRKAKTSCAQAKKPENMEDVLRSMTPEQIEYLKEQIAKIEESGESAKEADESSDKVED